MRFTEFTLRIPGGEFRMRFHERVTVVAGIGEIERSELLHSIVGALAGSAPGTTFTYVDATGETRTVDEGDHHLLAGLGLDVETLVQQILIDGSTLGLRPGHDHLIQHPELRDAHETLEKVTEELQAALSSEQNLERLRSDVEDLDRHIKLAKEHESRRAYARVLAKVERLRSEAAIAREGQTSDANERQLLSHRDTIGVLAARWHEAAEQLLAADAEFGDREPLPEPERLEAIRYPAQIPTEITDLSAEVDHLEARRSELVEQLASTALAELPEPSDPLVPQLAREPQDLLWPAAASLIHCRNRSRAMSFGLDPGLEIDDLEAAVDELEEAHAELEVALEAAEDGGVRNMFAGRRIAECERREQDALERLGLPSYLALHVRRLETCLDTDTRRRFEEMESERRLAEVRWRELVGDVDPVRAAALQAEIESYAEQLAAIDAVAGADLRAELENEVDPALTEARAKLAVACAPFGLDDTDMAVDMVRHQLERGRVARLQTELEEARANETRAAMALSDTLLDVGFGDGDLDARLGAYEWAVQRAEDRQTARQAARDPEVIEAELTRFEAEAAALRRPEWGEVSAEEGDEPPLEELHKRRAEAVTGYRDAKTKVPDMTRLRDKHKALTRRVQVLERDLRSRGLLGDSPADKARHELSARFTAHLRAAPDGGALPVVLDDALAHIDGDEKIDVLDLLERLSEKVQVVYLTDDVDVALWARRRASTDALMLLEPDPDDGDVDAPADRPTDDVTTSVGIDA